jgi:hypothetical protein
MIFLTVIAGYRIPEQKRNGHTKRDNDVVGSNIIMRKLQREVVRIFENNFRKPNLESPLSVYVI